MDEYPIVDRYMIAFAERVIERAQKNLNTSGFARKKGRKINSSGDLSKSLGFDLNKKGLEFTSTEKYSSIVEEGRKPGKMPPIDPIKKWITEKGVRLQKTVVKNGVKVNQFAQKTDANLKSAAFAIAKSIAKKGIRESNFFWEAFEYEWDRMDEGYLNALVRDLEDIIADNFSKNKYIEVR